MLDFHQILPRNGHKVGKKPSKHVKSCQEVNFKWPFWRRNDCWCLRHDLVSHFWVFGPLRSPEVQNSGEKIRLFWTKFPEISWFRPKNAWKSQKIKSFCWKLHTSIYSHVGLTCIVLAHSYKSISTVCSIIFDIFWLYMTFLVLEGQIFENFGQNFRKNAWKSWDFIGFW